MFPMASVDMVIAASPSLSSAIEESEMAVAYLSRNYALSAWCLTELAKIIECMEEEQLVVQPIFRCVEPNDVRNQRGAFAEAFAQHEELFRDSPEVVSLWIDAFTKVANIRGWVLNYGDPESQLIHDLIEYLSNRMLEDGSPNWNLPPRFDVTPAESDESDDADEMLPPEAHVVPDDVADVPQEAHVVEDHVANLPQLCPICDNAIGVAFCCGHMFCVECGDACDNCPICRDRVHTRLRVFLPHCDLDKILCPICDNAIGVAFCCGHMFCVKCGDACDKCPVCRDRVHFRFRVFLPQ